ncbi:T3SS (YopN, CesT) and YbjN peptide-binding chaperone 1 [Rhodococcoides corynebacterioides]|uniref:T3SS (YopN, CesT) and YbjN peptide-binding chaperone 1 n=1 Tax=Rhodococcoides corynebacterioides TaxID=53972 RepID=UPI003F7EC06F
MNEVDTLDGATRSAWATFRTLLADGVAALAAGDTLLIECPHTPSDPAPPCVQFHGWDESVVRCEVLADDYLAPYRAWTASGSALLSELGFHAPPRNAEDRSDTADESIPVNWYLDLGHRYADRAADACVRVLRDAWAVPHPSFLTVTGPADAEVCGIGRTVVSPAPAFDPFVAVRTADAAGRRALVEATLRHLLGFLPDADEDGDYPFRLGPARLYLCPTEDAPFVQILAPVAAGIEDTAHAAEVIADVNRRWPHVKLVLDEDRVVATVDVTVVPFVPQHVLDMLAVMEKFVAEAADDVVTALGARPYLDRTGSVTSEPAGRSPLLPESLCRLAEAVWERGADVSVGEVLALCGADRARIADLLALARGCENQSLTRTVWDDERVAASAGLDARVWRMTAALLTAAHRRLVAEARDGSSTVQLDLFGGVDPAGGVGDTLFD